ncbi:MAG: hypothetical protein ACTHK2_16915 [Dokdonella sp.]|uniref:hypothetical protein n=1 Tax=Dokdonella sp. TaxID=2291710 RepID=UPI003F7E96C1
MRGATDRLPEHAMRSRRPPATRLPFRRRHLASAALLGLLGCGIATAQIVAYAIAGGGGTSRSPGRCRVLEGSIGEPAAGVSSGAAFSLHAGYWAGPGSVQRDSLFDNGFEACQ